ncbi:hypothetical protein P4310_17230 [Bacillus thuringiensis]|nr:MULTISPECIES: hypothetical protein [Bacillus cereus group]MCX9102840.1 hypothetical protein [Bacillus anthracis]MED3067281.1 hypothetical protein [Bacillus thuringiensis]OUB38242.1 hypothetical protein BK737_00245 [Bacillus thuringiensis serovar palmanyolensis]PEO77828.1 hypothetical protein CN570_17685 [Bacillus toyonensis]
MFEKELLEFCKNGMSVFFMFEAVRKRIYSFAIVQICLFLTFLILCMIFKEVFDFIFMIYVFLMELSITSLFFIHMYVKRYILKEYKIKFEGNKWYNFKYLLLKKFLYNKKILSKSNKNKTKNVQALDFYIERFEKYLERKKEKKLSTIFKSSSTILIAFSVPLWTAFNNWMYQQNGFHLGQATAYFVSVFIILFFFFLFWVLIRYYFTFFHLDEQKIINVIEMLYGIKFSLNNNKYLEPFVNEDIDKLIIETLDKYELKIRMKNE